MVNARAQAEIGVIGGSGLYRFLEDAEPVVVSTPFGPPSEPPAVGQIAGRRVAFIPRHGRDHRFPPHRVNYRANLWALRALGVRQVIAPCAVGSLREDLGPGMVLVPDQVVDRTWGRAHSIYGEVGSVVHVEFAEPYCPAGRGALVSAAAGYPAGVREDGTLVVVNGPRFSSAAESRWHRAQGWSVVGMTGMPEAGIARELALCFSALCVVTDHDAGVEGVAAVTHAEVLRVFGEAMTQVAQLLHRAIAALPGPEQDCGCRHSLDGASLPFELP